MAGDYYYYRDEEGEEWGPFTNGPLGGLLNHEVLNKASMRRDENEEEWRSYYERRPNRQLISSSTLTLGESEEKRLRGNRMRRFRALAIDKLSTEL